MSIAPTPTPPPAPLRPERLRPMPPPTGRDPAAVRQRVEAMERLLERGFRLPGVNRPVGLDAVAGLVPILGDLLAAVLGSYLIWEGRNLGMSRWTLWRMAGNIAVDTTIGAVPVVGDAFDLLFRSNTRNLRLIKRHLDRHHPVIEG